ncbi:MAG: NAD(P)/FAD-dependent oxidoreductase, partial [Ginsengibacter sp.]
MYDIIIVGAGASGLMAAKLLSAEGKSILVLEAKDRLGGRIHRIENLSFPAEGGAEFIHGKLKTTFDLLKEAGLKKEKLTGKFCKYEEGEWNTANDIVPHWDLLVKKLKSCETDTSIDIFLSEHFHAEKYEKLRKQFRKYLEGYDAADPKNTSVFAIRKQMESEDEDQFRPVPDYYALINFLKESSLKKDVIIKTGEPVTQIISGENIEVHTTAGKYFCRKLIIAVPLGVLQCRKNNKSYIRFPLKIKNYINAAKKIGNGGVIKFLLEFDEAFWLTKDFLNERQIPAPSYIFADTIIPTWWTQYPSKKPLLTGWIAGPSSYKMKNYSEKKFSELIIQSLSKLFAMPVTEIESTLKKIVVSNWNKAPHFLGGYSYPTPDTKNAQKLLMTPFADSIYFTGEYLAENSSSTVDAA